MQARKEPQIIQQNLILLGGQTIKLRARQLVYILAHMMDKERPTDEITISAKELLGFINNTPGEKWTDLYAAAHDIFDNLNDNPILIKKKKGKDFTKINWLSKLGVEQGHLVARFSADIAEYFLYKQGMPYTKILWDLRPYHSRYTARILDLFQKYHQLDPAINEFSFNYQLEELKFFFGVHEKYPRVGDFEKRVLDTACRELEENDLAPYWFSHEKVKRGRSVVAIKFTVYVRPKVLLDLIPNLRLIKGGNPKQTTIFDEEREVKFTAPLKKVFQQLVKMGIKESFAQRILSDLSESQAVAYLYLVEYGVNRSLAYTIIKEHCSFGELPGYEDLYVKHTLGIIETQRLKRIRDHKAGRTRARITPDDKKGALPKKVFEERQHFSAFMERLSQVRHQQDNDGTRRSGNLGDIFKNMN